ncbi:uncharacterized protein PITG_13482 [Phytophthora infestans T30-4]|uniref:Uncharacterized protein n=1 Tax=Phytophthora infestans (strain T30-4) TaxID=403677 RepID=D0NM35_PHYIT|nr:uncharacterized protein PITG_13482 [Phytophthora infestans T30-4]EEY60756.1 conserved hypothetical protein [Phytophthora infestans T30-4]|eukprot:XP_002899702.1 conserved hypothetical protein [Phytophthora infestans T30-4]
MADAGGEAGTTDGPVPTVGDFDTGLHEPLSDDEMLSLFQKHRRTRRKPVAVTRTVTPNLLDNAWTYFVSRWNTEGAVRFIPSLERRETDHEERSVSALARRIHNVAYDADRIGCYVHYAGGCTWCTENGRPRPRQGAWEQEVSEYPVSEAKQNLVGQYRRALSDVRRGGPPRHPEDLPPLERLPRTPSRSPERHQEATMRLPTIVHWAKPTLEVLAVRRNRNGAGVRPTTRTRTLGSGTVFVVPQDRLHDMTDVASTINEGCRTVTLEPCSVASARRPRPLGASSAQGSG